jgi:hypothetical protein
MTWLASLVHRLVLRCYPATFRAEYGEAMSQLLRDQLRDGRPLWRLVCGEALDVARVAPRMRWEHPMNRFVLTAFAVTTAIVAAVVAKVMLLPLALILLGAWHVWGRELSGPVAARSRSVRWLGIGVLGIIAAIAIPAIDGGELNGFWWTISAATLLAGIATTVTGAMMALNSKARRLNH